MKRILRVCVILAVIGVLGAAPGAASRGLVVRVTVTGSGVVATPSGRIRCRTVCRATFRRGTGIRLDATPDANFRFAHWAGACVGVAPTCLVAVDQALMVGATFERLQGTMHLTVSGHGSIAIDPGGRVVGGGDYEIPKGLTITLTPRPDAGAALQGWGGACESAPVAACTFVAGEAHEVAAAFGQAAHGPGSHTLTADSVSTTVRSTPPGIDCHPECSATFQDGTLVTLRADNPAPMFWAHDCGGTAHTCVVFMDGDHSAMALVPPYEGWGSSEAQVTVSGPGRVSGSGIECGRRATACYLQSSGPPISLRLAATPAHGARFGGWAGGVCSGKSPRCEKVLSGSHAVVAFFRKRRR